MSFLDNLENNLKSLESAEEGRESAEKQQRERARAKADAAAAAPFADALKNGPFTQELLRQAARVGFSLRTKIHVAWLGPVLRLEAREKRLELRPTASGVQAVYLEENRETASRPLDLAGNPEQLLRAWLLENRSA